MYACVLDLPALNTRLPDRIDDRVVKDANRQLTRPTPDGYKPT